MLVDHFAFSISKEILQQVPRIFCPNMAVNELREIGWVGSITMATTSGGTVKIPEPSSYTGPRPVKIRVLSYYHRQVLVSFLKSLVLGIRIF